MNVVIVGASSGIGRAAALAFARNGCSVVVAARDSKALAQVADECRRVGAPAALPAPCDVSSAAAVDALVAAAGALGPVDVWVHAAAVLTVGQLADVPVDTIEQAVAIDVAGSALSSRAAMRLFAAQGRGTLINVSSWLGVVPNPMVPVYCMSKFAISGLTKSLQESVPRRGPVRVCLVLFGPVDTPVFQRAANYSGRRPRAIPPAASVERAAATIVSCARRPRRVATLGFTGWGLRAGHRLAPGLTMRLVAQASARLLMTDEPAPDSSGAVAGPAALPDDLARASGGWRRVPIRARAGDAVGRWAAARGGR
jgi:NAD(P)-dependent dehydrogenase (short-subunit alcohol dehydrogenase family)